MKGFIIGVLITVAVFNAGAIKRFLHDATGDDVNLHSLTGRIPHSNYHPKHEGPAPRLSTKSEVQEPDLDRMEELGFNVERQ